MAITSTSNTEKNGEDKTAPAPSPTVQDGAVPQVRDVAHIFGKAVHINGIIPYCTLKISSPDGTAIPESGLVVANRT